VIKYIIMPKDISGFFTLYPNPVSDVLQINKPLRYFYI